MAIAKRPPPPKDFDENPEWSEDDLAQAEPYPQYMARREQIERLRNIARLRREEADRVDADALAGR